VVEFVTQTPQVGFLSKIKSKLPRIQMPEQDSLNTTGDLASLDTYDNNTSTVADDATHPTTPTPQLSKHKRFRILLLKILEKPSSSIWV
jgi:hypothetical protein